MTIREGARGSSSSSRSWAENQPAFNFSLAWSPFFLLLLLVLVSSAEATVYYVNSASGSDSNSGTSSTKAWKTLTKVSNVGYSPGFKAGDQILLAGTFTTGLWFDLTKTYGTAASPVAITSQSAAAPATISVNNDNAILMYDASTAPALGLGFNISNLKLVGNNALSNKGKTTGGVFVWHSGKTAVDFLSVTNVNASGFTEGGIVMGRDTGAGYLTNVFIRDTVAYNNKGYANIARPVGNGIVLGGVNNGLVERCEAYGNGQNNNNAGGGPVGIWTWDSTFITIRNCTSHDNLSSKNDGGGFDLDSGVYNSIIENCVSYNNYGPGYEACSMSGLNNSNNTIRWSTSYGDGWGRGFATFGVFANAGSSISSLSVYGNNFTTVTTKTCPLWSTDYTGQAGLWLSGTVSGISWTGNTLVCKNQNTVYTTNLLCYTGSNPLCS